MLAIPQLGDDPVRHTHRGQDLSESVFGLFVAWRKGKAGHGAASECPGPTAISIGEYTHHNGQFCIGGIFYKSDKRLENVPTEEECPGRSFRGVCFSPASCALPGAASSSIFGGAESNKRRIRPICVFLERAVRAPETQRFYTPSKRRKGTFVPEVVWAS